MDSKLTVIQKIYADALSELLAYLKSELDGKLIKADNQRMQKIIKHVEAITAKLDDTVQEEIKQLFTEIFEEKAVRSTLIRSDADYQKYLKVAESKIRYLTGSTMDDLLQATDYTEMRLKQIVRELFTERTSADLMLGKGAAQITADISSKLTEKGFSKLITEDGFVGIVDASGRRWSLQRYVDMVVQTKLTEADVETDRATGVSVGIDLAYISHHGATDDCSKWEHVLISMNGLTAGYPTYEQVKASKECFHPNCQHHLNPVRSFELAPEIVQAATLKWQQLNA